MNIMEIFGTIKDICLTITGFITVMTLFSKPVRKLTTNLFSRMSKSETNQALLRNEITKLYYKYLPEQSMPLYARENLMSLYDKYKKEGGNSFIDSLYNDMMIWSVQKCGETIER